MRNLLDTLTASIPTLAAQLLIIGGAVALVGMLLFALTMAWQRWSTKNASRDEAPNPNRRPAPTSEIGRTRRAKNGVASLVAQISSLVEICDEDVADMINVSSLSHGGRLAAA